MRRGMKIVMAIFIFALVVGVAGGVFAFMTVINAAKADEYNLGDDTIKSINFVVGERKVTSISTSIENGRHTKQIIYDVGGNAQQDITAS
jgi:uncharacterized protein YneF (UPF0154 family)